MDIFFPYTFPFMFLVNLFVPTASSSWNVKQLQLVVCEILFGKLLVQGKLRIRSNNRKAGGFEGTVSKLK